MSHQETGAHLKVTLPTLILSLLLWVKGGDHKLEAGQKDDIILVLSGRQNSTEPDDCTEQGLGKYASHVK